MVKSTDWLRRCSRYAPVLVALACGACVGTGDRTAGGTHEDSVLAVDRRGEASAAVGDPREPMVGLQEDERADSRAPRGEEPGDLGTTTDRDTDSVAIDTDSVATVVRRQPILRTIYVLGIGSRPPLAFQIGGLDSAQPGGPQPTERPIALFPDRSVRGDLHLSRSAPDRPYMRFLVPAFEVGPPEVELPQGLRSLALPADSLPSSSPQRIAHAYDIDEDIRREFLMAVQNEVNRNGDSVFATIESAPKMDLWNVGDETRQI